MTPEHATKWKAIGKFLELSEGTLDIIDYDHRRSEACCNEMWGRWLDTKINASWGTVISAIDFVNTLGDPEVLSIVKGKCIKKRSEISKDDWPPYQPETYTTVVLIHHNEKIAYEEAVIAVANEMYNGIITSPCTSTIDETKSLTSQMRNSYLSSCRYIRNVSEIFPSDYISPYTLLIEGAPGIGKTILTKEIAFLWANRKILQDIKLLVSVYLRDPSVHKIATFTDFAKHITSTYHQNKMIEDFTCYLFNTSGKDIMFVFDGYDELPESL